MNAASTVEHGEMTELFAEHDRFVAHAARLVGPESAEDVVQTAYLKAWRARASYSGSAKPSSWFFAIVRHAAFDALRRRRRRPETPVEVLFERAVHDRGLQRLEAFSELATWRRDDAVLLLRIVRLGSQRDAAESLGLNVQTLKTRLHRARRRHA